MKCQAALCHVEILHKSSNFFSGANVIVIKVVVVLDRSAQRVTSCPRPFTLKVHCYCFVVFNARQIVPVASFVHLQ